MIRDEDYYLNKLKQNEVLYNIFCCMGDYSTVYHEEFNFLEAKAVKLEDIIIKIKSEVIDKDDVIIQGYIDTIIRYGLCEYKDENGKVFINTDSSNDIDKTLEDIKIALTNKSDEDCPGVMLYKKIIYNKRDEKIRKDFSNGFESAINEVLKPYNEKIEIVTKDLDDKMNKLNQAIDNGVIKNIQVISIFAGIISLLFANIMGMKEFASIGVLGLLIINLSITTSLFVLILFTKLLIVGGKFELKAIITCLVTLLVITIPIILIVISNNFISSMKIE